MADIFISYAKEDRERAEVLAATLGEQGWSVWWDRIIPTGRIFDEVIEEELDAAKCVIVLWSSASVRSEWVKTEADAAKEKLLPALIEEVQIPLAFRRRQAVDLVDWDGNPTGGNLPQLVADMGRILGSPPTSLKERETARKAVKEAATEAPVYGSALIDSAFPEPREEDERLNPRIPIEGGTFQMGSADDDPYADDDEKPQRPVTVSPFWIQKYPVTNEEYRRFRESHEFEAGKERHPVVEVTWDDAMAYAKWLGGSLPTEAQWECAARGKDGREYPWGASEPSPEHANYLESAVGGTTPVGKYQKGATPEGVHDLVGNVWEWCSDWYGPYAATEQTDPLGPPSGTARVLRGGSFNLTPRYLRSAYRDDHHPDLRIDFFGFRVAWPASGGLDE